MIKRRYTFNNNKITATLKDSSGYYLWIAYLGSGGSCILKKVSAFNPKVIYFNLTISVDIIKRIKQDSTYIYLAVDSSSYVGIKISKTNPLSSITYISKPEGITEPSIDLAVGSTYLYLLFAGEMSATTAKVLKYNKTSLALASTITLDGSAGDIYNTRTITIDGNGIVWIATYENPIKLIKLETDDSYEYWEIL